MRSLNTQIGLKQHRALQVGYLEDQKAKLKTFLSSFENIHQTTHQASIKSNSEILGKSATKLVIKSTRQSKRFSIQKWRINALTNE